MSTLWILPASFASFPPDELTTLLGAMLAGETTDPDACVLHPAGVALDPAVFGASIPYAGAIGLEHNQAVWRPLRARRFDEIRVVGLDARASAEEILLACYLEADRKAFLGTGGWRDMAPWQQAARPDFASRPAVLKRLGADDQRAYVQSVHRWLGAAMSEANFEAPRPPVARSPEALIYRMPTLASDLAAQTEDLSTFPFDRPFGDMMCMDGTFVRTTDYHRAFANLVIAVDGMTSVLDVGCGSGLLSLYLAGSGRYADVLGIDASPERIRGARLYGELNNSAARFEVMSMAGIGLPDRSVDISVTCYALEQSGPHLARCFAEIVRVTRRMIVMFEPTIEFFPSLPGLWHVPFQGWATDFHATLVTSGLAYAARPLLINQYYNCGAAIVVDLESREHPRLRFPHLFGLDAASWPGGVTFV